MSRLFEPLTLRSITLKNRVGVSPMCQYSALDGIPQPWHFVHLGSRAVGGAGLVIAEATGILPEGRITSGCTGIWSDKHTEAWAPIAAFVKSQGAVPAIQIGHAGRKASAALPWNGGEHLPLDKGGWEIVAPSAIAFGGGLTRVPKAMDAADIAKIRTAFKESAQRALKAGFEWLELHCAHGYLMHEFLSPLSNHRTDDYGGSFENRIRLAGEVVKEVRSVWPEKFPLALRISATDWEEGGWDLQQSIELAKRVKALGVDLIDCSSAGMTPTAKVVTGPGYQVQFSEAIRREAGMATAAVGQITDPAQAEAIIASGQSDIVLLARAELSDPYWPSHAAKALGVADACRLPHQYGRA